jgi:hypothetical protein
MITQKEIDDAMDALESSWLEIRRELSKLNQGETNDS